MYRVICCWQGPRGSTHKDPLLEGETGTFLVLYLARYHRRAYEENLSNPRNLLQIRGWPAAKGI